MSVSIPLVRAASLQLATRFLEETGAPVEQLLERARLSPRAIENPDTLIPFVAVTRFVEDTARGQGIADLGLRMGARSAVHQLGTFGRLISRSLTLHDAIETAYRIWSGFNSGVQTWLTRHRDQVALHHRFLCGGARDWGQYAAATLMTYLNFLGSAAGPGWRPTVVGFPLASLSGLRAVPLLADTRVEFGRPWMTVTFAATVLHRPLPRLPGAAPKGTTTDWKQSTPAADVGGALQQIVTSLLPDGYPDIQLVAEVVRMSPRTLQRRLQGEGLTFAGVVAKARFSEAQRMLGDPARKVIDVALDLGYSDPAHFTRAFERWTGVGPREFRRRAAESGDPIGS